jgi:hypothetical protein
MQKNWVELMALESIPALPPLIRPFYQSVPQVWVQLFGLAEMSSPELQTRSTM